MSVDEKGAGRVLAGRCHVETVAELEGFYGEDLPRLREGLEQLNDLAEGFACTEGNSDDLKPVVYYTSRIKSPESLVEKVQRKGGDGSSLARLTHEKIDQALCALEKDKGFDGLR